MEPERHSLKEGKGAVFNNPAELELWSDPEWRGFRVFEAEPRGFSLTSDQRRQQQAALRGLSAKDACFWLSLVAHARKPGQLDWLTQSRGGRPWGPVPVAEMESAVKEASHALRVTIQTLVLEVGDYCRLNRGITAACKGSCGFWRLLLVPSTVGYHVLPICQENDDMVRKSKLFPVVAEPPVVVEPKQPEVAVPCPPCLVAVEQPKVANVDPEWLDLGETAVGLDSANQGDPAVPLPLEGDGALNEFRVVYHGPWEPPHGMLWRSGQWSSTLTSWKGQGLHPIDDLMDVFYPAHVYAATTQNIEEFGTGVHFLPVPEELRPPLRYMLTGTTRARTVTDGLTAAQIFKAGDTVVHRGHKYAVLERNLMGYSTLRLSLVDWTFGQAVRGAIDATIRLPFNMICRVVPDALVPSSLRAPRSTHVVPHGLVNVAQGVMSRAQYATFAKYLPEEQQATFGIFRSTSAAVGYEGEFFTPAVDAVQASKELVSVSATIPHSLAGGAPFAHGKCFSCGDEYRRGKRMPGRLCGCPMTPAARSAAQGYHVCALNSVVYPGVVSTSTCHPPLKSGKKSAVGPQAFRFRH